MSKQTENLLIPLFNYLDNTLEPDPLLVTVQLEMLQLSGVPSRRLWQYFFSDPCRRLFMLSIIAPMSVTRTRKHNAQELFRLWENGVFDKEQELEVFSALAVLNHGPILPVLADIVFHGDPGDYWRQRCASLGLLHLDCRDLQDDIERTLRKCLRQERFPEFWPVLLSKLVGRGLRQRWMKLFFEHGEKCSCDNNAGLLEAFSLCRQDGLPYFQRALFNPHWNCGGNATSRAVAYRGLKRLEVKLSQLWTDIEIQPAAARANALNLLLHCLSLSAHDLTPLEPAARLYERYFSNHFLSGQVEEEQRDWAWTVRDQLEIAMRGEALRTLAQQPPRPPVESVGSERPEPAED